MKRSVPPVTLELRTSRWERLLIALALGAAIVSCLMAGLPIAARIGLIVAAVAFAAAAWLHASMHQGWRLILFADVPARVREASGAEFEADLVDATILGPLTSLSFRRLEGGTLNLALFPDSALTEDLRRLRVFLRHGPQIGTDEPPIQ